MLSAAASPQRHAMTLPSSISVERRPSTAKSILEVVLETHEEGYERVDLLRFG